MSAYGRAPNVSQYIANLNSIPAGQETGVQRQQNGQHGPLGQQEIGSLDEDLTYFSNAELFDFELSNTGAEPPAYIGSGKAAKAGNGSDMGFNGNFSTFFESSGHAPLQLNTEFVSTGNFDPQLFQSPTSATFPQSAGGPQQQDGQPGSGGPEDQQSPGSGSGNAGQAAGSKRSHSVSSPPASVEEAARMAAEEDKRRRNTAASARFRVKKKQREAALEKTAKEMTDKVEQLQKRVSELEMENKWLRGLVVEKGMSVKKEGDEGAIESGDNRIPDKQAKNGVGTKTESA